MILHGRTYCLQVSLHYSVLLTSADPEKLAVKFGFKTFITESKNYPGHDMDIAVQVASLKTIFTNRIVEEIVAYFGAFAEINAAILSATSHVAAAAAAAASEAAQKKTQASPKMKLDILVSNPIVVVPQNSFTDDHFIVSNFTSTELSFYAAT